MSCPAADDPEGDLEVGHRLADAGQGGLDLLQDGRVGAHHRGDLVGRDLVHEDRLAADLRGEQRRERALWRGLANRDAGRRGLRETGQHRLRIPHVSHRERDEELLTVEIDPDLVGVRRVVRVVATDGRVDPTREHPALGVEAETGNDTDDDGPGPGRSRCRPLR